MSSDFSNEALGEIIYFFIKRAISEGAISAFNKTFPGKTLSSLIGLLRHNYFYHEKLIKALLYNQDWKTLKSGEYVDYSLWNDPRNYINEKDLVTLNYGDESKTIFLPYKTLVDFIKFPRMRIDVSGKIKAYRMSSGLEELTNGNLQAFLKSKPDTTDGSVLRVSDFVVKNNNRCLVTLESATYFQQVRTNLTIDFPTMDGKTLRTEEFTKSRGLRSFKNSNLVNSIGCSSVVFYRQGRDKYFFMHLRKNLGVFEYMLSTVSGVLEYSLESPIGDLRKCAEQEMKREFITETGLNSNVIKSITPLAFVRDLVRGGKPQFFFLIEIAELKNDSMSKSFRKSIEGENEFLGGVLGKATMLTNAISPEFFANLVYAFQFLQKKDKLDRMPIFC